MVFRGRLRFPDADLARRAAAQLERVELLNGRITASGAELALDVRVAAEATAYPDVLTALDEVADLALGGSVACRLGGQPSDQVVASAPLPGLDGVSYEAQDLLRAVLGGDVEAVEAGRSRLAGGLLLLEELLVGWPLLETPEQRALFVLLVGDRSDPELVPVMRAALDLPGGAELLDRARHRAQHHLAGARDPTFERSDGERLASEAERPKTG